MLMVLLMSMLVSAEWVEISQNHYKKEPFRYAVSDPTKPKNNIYNNYSTTEHQWSKGYVDRVSGIDEVQRQRVLGVERKPSVKIERNPFYNEDLITMDSPKRRVQINGLKSENSIKENVKYENRDNAGSVQRIHQTTTKNEHPMNDKSMSENNLFTNKNYNIDHNKHVNIENINSKTITASITGTLALDKTEANGANSHLENVKRNFQDKNKKNSSDKQNYSPPKGEKENKRNQTKTNGLESLIKLIKIVSQTIQRGSHRSFSGKVRYLEDLKTSILSSIEDRIESAFPDDTVTQRRRRSSGFHDSRGHVEFPSSESALMTISFLTFAVFLIKLVLQVIHTYKAKTMMVTPAVVATVGRAGNVFRAPSNN